MSVSQELIIFAHIPKTAGSTLAAIARKNYSKVFEFYRVKNQPGTSIKEWIGDFNSSTQEQESISQAINKKKFLRGHVGFGIDRFLQFKSCTYITMLRDPVERVISHYYFLQKKQMQAALKMSLEDFVASGKFVTTDNLQTRFLSGIGWQSFDPKSLDFYDKKFDVKQGKCDANMLEQAKDSLTKYFVFGLQNQMDESLNLFRDVFAWKKTEVKVNRNTSNSKSSRDNIEPSLVKLIEQKNSLDIQLYEYAQKYFEHQFQDIKDHSRLIHKKTSHSESSNVN